MAQTKRSNTSSSNKSAAAKARSGNPALRAEAKAAASSSAKVARPRTGATPKVTTTTGSAKPASKPTAKVTPKGPVIKPKLGHAHDLTIGDKAPNFTLTTSDGGHTSLSDLRKKAKRGIVIFFFNDAASKTCTAEAAEFRSAYATFAKAGFEVVGISPNNRADLAKFKADNKLPFILAADPNSKTARKYGAYGKIHKYAITQTMPDQFHRLVPKTTGPIRATFVIDQNGRIEQVVPAVHAKGHVAKLLKRLKLV